VIESNQNLSVS